jgi:hypothetical protein
MFDKWKKVKISIVDMFTLFGAILVLNLTSLIFASNMQMTEVQIATFLGSTGILMIINAITLIILGAKRFQKCYKCYVCSIEDSTGKLCIVTGIINIILLVPIILSILH